MKGIRGSTEFEKQFVDIFKQLCNRHHAWQVWQDFVDMSACSIANAVDRRQNVWKLREDSYMEKVKRYSKDELNFICELFSITILALEENPAQDFLGKLYMQLDFGKGWHGQFFTPWNVAELMAKIQMNDGLKEQILQKEYISMNDSCCGAGVMLIAFANICKSDLNINFQRSVFFVGQDIDEVVAKMCYIQISLLGCPGYVVVGNSISEPICGSLMEPDYKKPENIWLTPLYFTDIWTLRRIRSLRGESQEQKEINTASTIEKDEKYKEKLLKKPADVPVKENKSKESETQKKPSFWREIFNVKGMGKK